MLKNDMKVTIVVDLPDGKGKATKIITFREYKKMLDDGKKPQTVGIVPELNEFWKNRKDNW